MLSKSLCLLIASILCRSHAADLTVSAAASLTDAFNDIGKAYTEQYPEDKVFFNFAGSGALLKQLQNGAPIDVFASADQLRMDIAEKEQLIQSNSRVNFAQNALVVIVPKDSNIQPQTLVEFVEQSKFKRIAIANPESVPVGTYSKNALESAGLWEKIGERNIPTHNVRQALDYVARGEVDAGFVYATDAAMMKDKVSLSFQVPLDEALAYPIAVSANSQSPEAAARFVQFVLSQTGQRILRDYGFLAPETAKN